MSPSKEKNLLSLDNVVELCVAVLIFYNFWYIRIMGESAIIHWSFFLLLVGCLILKKDIVNIISYSNKPCLWYWIFTGVTGVLGFLVAVNVAYQRTALIDNLEYAVFFSVVLNISKEKKSYQWILRIFVVVVFLCGVTAIYQGHEHNGRLILGSSGNSNDLGIKMVYGICCLLLMDSEKVKILNFARIGIGLVMGYAIIQTASRKAALIAAAVLVAWAILALPKTLSRDYKGFAVLIYIMLIGLAIYGVYAYLPQYYGTKSYTRFLYASEGADTRWALYKDAFDIFKQYPIIGVGLNNYSSYSATLAYSHSTIAETVVDTGIVGSIIWVVFIITYAVDFIALIKTPLVRKNDKFWISLICFGGSLVFSVVVILYFNFASMLFLAVIAAVIDDLKGTYLKKRVERNYR